MDRGMPLLALSQALGAGGGHKHSLTLSTMPLNESLLLEKMALTAGSLSAGERDQGELTNTSHLASLGLGSSVSCGCLDPRTHPVPPLHQL